jgi:septal ring factor EnvC (AmiA/AmiB activator)
VNLWKSVKAAGMNVPYILTLLKVANNPLPAVENRYEQLKKEISLLEFDKRNSARDFQNLNDQIISMGKTLDSIHLDREKEMARLQHLQQERMNQDALVNHFKNNNEAYVKLTKTVEDKVHSILVDRKELLGRAVLCVIESIRKDPDKYAHLIYYNDDHTPPSEDETRNTMEDNNNNHHTLSSIAKSIYRLGHSDTFGYHNCKQKGDKWFMQKHFCQVLK